MPRTDGPARWGAPPVVMCGGLMPAAVGVAETLAVANDCDAPQTLEKEYGSCRKRAFSPVERRD